MSLVTYHGLLDLIKQGVIKGVAQEQINGASIDLTLGDTIQVEEVPPVGGALVDLKDKEAPHFREVRLDSIGYAMAPGEFLLAHTEQVFHLPNGVAGEYKLKSSLARAGLNHALAGWCDPGWHGSQLTLELQNTTRYHQLLLRPGMKIGQVVLWIGEDVPALASYAVRGQYNRDRGAQPSKGLR